MSGATSPEAETIIRQQDTINRLMGQSASRIDQVQRSLDQAWASQQRFQQAQQTINAAVERGRITQERANQLLEMARSRYQQTAAAAQAFAVANDNAARGSRNFGGVIGQAGFQVQDFAVQVQGGTSVLTAFIQQGSQLAGAFGPGGAIVGAALAVAGITAALLLGRTEAERFKEAMERNREAFERATTAAERWRNGLRDEARQIQDLQAYYRTLNAERQQYELRHANRAAREVEERRAALERDALRGLPGLSQGFQDQVRDAEMLAARNYGRGSAEFQAIMSDDTLRRMREAISIIESFRETNDVSENALAAFSARLREMAAVLGGELGRYLVRTAEEMERLGQRSRDVERDSREVNARLEALGATASQAAGRVAELVTEMGRLQRQAQQDIGQENQAAIRRAEERAQALARGLAAAREFDARASQTEAGDRYYREQRRQDEERLRTARFTEDQIREELTRTEEARRQTSNRRAELEAQNARRLRELEDADRARQRAGRAGAVEARREDRLDERARRERDQLIASLDQEAAATIRLEEAQRRVENARRRNLLTEEEARDLAAEATRRRDEEIRRLYDKSELDADATKRVAQLTSEVGSIMGDAFSSLVREGRTFEDTLKNLERQLLRLGDKYLLQPLFDQLAQLAMMQFGGGGNGGGGLGGILSSLAGTGGGFTKQLAGGGFTKQLAGEGLAKGAEAVIGAVLHDGGVVGRDGGRRALPAEVFLDAPRYHSGGVAGRMPFADDEVPAVLRRGELVLTKPQQDAVSSGMSARSITQTVIVKTEDPGAFNRTRDQTAREMRRNLARAARST